MSGQILTDLIQAFGPTSTILLLVVIYQIRERRNGKPSPEIGILTDIVDKIETHGSVPFQTYKAEDKEWKRGASRRFDQHSDRIDSNRDAAHSVSDRLAKIQAEHNAYMKKNGGHSG